MDEVFTEEQLKRLNNIKKPTVTKVIELSNELNIDMKIIFNFYVDRYEKIIRKDIKL